MEVLKRVLVKSLILLFVVGVMAGGAAAYQGQRQSTAGYTVDAYLKLLLEDNSSRAWSFVDRSDDVLTEAEFAEAAEGKKYGIYASYEAEELEKRRDNDGNEYTDFHVKFYDAANELKAEEDLTAKKQSNRRLGIFDVWKVLGDHCLVRDFRITVPAGSVVYLNSEKADVSWMTREENSPAEVYTIPRLLPDNINLTIRHPVLESVNTVFNSADGPLDYSTSMELKDSAQGECKELGVSVLKNLLSASVKQQAGAVDDSLEACRQKAESFVRRQGNRFNAEGSTFVSMAASAFAAEFGDPEYSKEDGSIRLEMKLSYHYRLKKDVTTQSEDQFNEDGTPVETVETVADTGNSTGTFVMSYTDGAWKVADLDLPVIS